MPLSSFAVPYLSESFTEESLQKLTQEGWEPPDESRATEISAVAELTENPSFPQLPGSSGSSLRLASGSLILPLKIPNFSFWLYFLM
ncbi:MAG: hypothetical protein N2035_08885 [Chthoniobacterales bacterium]|nr:hypothetical protein [Chthoniobacterales bacterium]